VAEPNDRLRAARERVESPLATGLSLSREELADLVNQQVFTTSRRVIDLTANYIGKLERGQIRWPQADYRSGLRVVLGVDTDAELGFEAHGGAALLSMMWTAKSS
jgi:transcriptional regulator with XRE-family HTH domain